MKTPRSFIIAAITALAVVTAACGDDDTTETTAATTTTSAGVTTVASTIPSTGGAAITVSNFQFTPNAVSVAVGETVTFAFAGTHTTTSVDDLWDSGNKSAGETFDVTLDAPGSYEFFCSIHASMRGTITVTG